MEFLAERTAFPLAFIPFATSIVLVMGSPEAKPAQPRALVGGHLLSAAVGLLTVTIAGPQPWVCGGRQGHTYGAAAEWYKGQWTLRGGLFDLSVVPNSAELDRFHQFQIVYELEHRHEIAGQPGKIALDGFVTRGRMGLFDSAIVLAEETGGMPNTALVRHYATRTGFNLNFEQQVATDIGMFGRFGWANGDIEPYEFTDIDRTASMGIALDGTLWGRTDDDFGLAGVVNEISSAHIAYLDAGGLGILVGDGKLPHPTARVGCR
jgi:high affinity Mn2+ porin